jgi:hypothetical protein
MGSQRRTPFLRQPAEGAASSVQPEADVLGPGVGLGAESGRFPGVRFRTAPVGLGKLFACLKLRYRPLQSINFA